MLQCTNQQMFIFFHSLLRFYCRSHFPITLPILSFQFASTGEAFERHFVLFQGCTPHSDSAKYVTHPSRHCWLRFLSHSVPTSTLAYSLIPLEKRSVINSYLSKTSATMAKAIIFIRMKIFEKISRYAFFFQYMFAQR